MVARNRSVGASRVIGFAGIVVAISLIPFMSSVGGLFRAALAGRGESHVGESHVAKSQRSTAPSHATTIARQHNSTRRKLASSHTKNVPNLPSPTLPQPNVPNPSLPNPQFPDPQFPRVEFPEVQSNDVEIRQGEGQTIYTVPADILFDFDRSQIRPDAERALSEIANSIQQRSPNASLHIHGHTDAVGTDDYNLTLSESRAESVRQWLITEAGLDGESLRTQGWGETQPVADNNNADGSDNQAGRQQNRRVEIVVQSPESTGP